MNCILFLVLLSAYFSHVITASSKDLQISEISKNFNTNNDCIREGYTCLDCYTLQECHYNKINETYDEYLQDCHDVYGSTCSEEGYCSADHRPECHPSRARCTDEGYKCLNCTTSQKCIWNSVIGFYSVLTRCEGGEMCSINGICSRHEEPHCPTNNSTCKSEGYKCINCTTSQTCIWDSVNGGFYEVLTSCHGGEMCSINGTCSRHEEPHCPSNNTTCKSEGHRCLDCYTSQECVWNERNNTFEEHLHSCYNGQTCSVSSGNCTHYHDPQCFTNTTNPGEFECRTPGMYPDPRDCKKYHYCVPGNEATNYTLISYAAECECDFGYNALTKDCDIKLNNSKCAYPPVSRCYDKGQNGALAQNPRIYYVCTSNSTTAEEYPHLYGCEHGKVYNKLTYLCE